ncbi:MAG: hypothetical protein JXR97_16880 [Planctomycetes bacterium]|nr:hypothetical protein [Planctomycetota bacterium]
MKGFLRFGAVALLFMFGIAQADDSSMRSEIDDLRAKVAALESVEMAPAAGGDASSLTSMKKKGAIKIGGKVEVAIVVTDRDDVPHPVTDSEDDSVFSTQFTTASVELAFDIAATKDTGLKIMLDPDDFWDEDPDQDDLLEEVYFYWKNIRGSNWGVNLGKKELCFGQDFDKLVLAAVTNSDSHSTLLKSFEENDTADSSADNSHGEVGEDSWPREEDNVFTIEANYKYKDLLKWEVAVFQSNTTTGGGRNTRGMHEDRSDDTLFFQSMSTRLTATPIEGLSIELSFMKEHNDSNGDEDAHGKYAEDDKYAVSLGAEYKVKSVPLTVFGEYLHGWDWDWREDYSADVLQLGVKYGVTDKIDLFLIGNWVGLDDDHSARMNSTKAGEDNEDLLTVQTAIQYKLDSGMIFSLEYEHEWWDGDYHDAKDRSAEADRIAFGTIWKF